MANKTNTSTLKHSSPGLYFNEVDLTYSAKSLGITTLGVAGETLRGPAFQPISIANWRQFTTMFGGTSTAKFKGSQYPKYELPYIAKSYLEQSEQLEVVRVLGLSGVNAGPAWVITGNKHKVFTGYTYDESTQEPLNVVWTDDNTVEDPNDIPSIPNITVNDENYYRLVTGYSWHSYEGTPASYQSARCYYNENPEAKIPNALIFRAYSNLYSRVSAPNSMVNYETVTEYPGDLTMIGNEGDLVNDRRLYITYEGVEIGESMDMVVNDAANNKTCYFTARIEKIEDNKAYFIATYIDPNSPNPDMLMTGDTYGLDCIIFPIEGVTDFAQFLDVNGNPIADHKAGLVSSESHKVKYYEIPGEYYESLPNYLYYSKVFKTNLLLPEEDFCGYNNMALLVLRSRGEHKRSSFVRTPTEADIANGICDDIYAYDGIEYYAKDIRLEPAKSLKLGSSCNPGYSAITGDFSVDAYNLGKFVIVVTTNSGEEKRYSVSLNSGEKDYIYNVIGGNPEDGDAEVYVEELYDVALRQLIESGDINTINSEVVKYPGVSIIPSFADVNDFVENVALTKKDANKRFIWSDDISLGSTVRYTTDNGTTWYEGAGMNGCIYTGKGWTNPETGKKEYFYGAYANALFLEYKNLPAEPENITWTYGVNKFMEPSECNFFNSSDIRNQRYLFMTSDFVFNGDEVTSNGGNYYVNNNVLSEAEADANSLTSTVYRPFHGQLTTTHDFNNTTTIIVKTPEGAILSGDNKNAKVFSFNMELAPTAYEYEWQPTGNANEYVATNAIKTLTADTYDFIFYGSAIGEYKITITTNDEGVVKVDSYTVTMLNNPNAFYENKVVNLTPSTSKNKTEFLTEYSYATDVDSSNYFRNAVKVLADNLFYILKDGIMVPVTLDFNNYREPYRYSSTPWVVSEIKGSAEDITLNKLFRFHTISDGNASSSEIKVSIENIDPMAGTFDVLVRDFNDSDLNTVILERYNNCNLVPGTNNYIALKIGSFDNSYVTVSNYITVEVNENDVTKLSVPCGFLGYPLRNYNGTGIIDDSVEFPLSTNPTQPYFKFNTTIDEDVKLKRQYFGVSDLVGIDTDVLTYKGVEAYNGLPDGMTPCFHLDARIFNGKPDADGSITEDGIKQTVNVDGVTGYTWVTVNKNQTTDEGIEPRIGDDETMLGTIYENKANRKFTMAFYGGWDGWDYYRTIRSTGDEFTYRNYKGEVNKSSGYGYNFNVISGNSLGLSFGDEVKAISSDYYAYLGAVRQFENPKNISISVLAAPGIEFINTPLLCNSVIDMVESRGDCVYPMSLVDKPAGSDDSVESMYTPDEMVAMVEDSGIDTSYAYAFYPWEKYYDSDNSQYIYLSPTRDVCKAIALTDNISESWIAATGYNRGVCSGVSPRRKLRLSEQDTLYDGRLNFINTFAGESDRLWGDKNFQISDTQLNRMSTRRLLIRIRKLLENSCIGLIFNPLDNTMGATIKSNVESVLEMVKQKRGVVDYRVEIIDTPEMRDQYRIACNYYIKRANNLEYLQFTAVLTPNGMEW